MSINGDLGLSPGSAVTGFPPGLVSGGTIHAADAVAVQAQRDSTTAYLDLAGRPCGTNLTGQNLGGLTLTPGVYCFSSSAQLTGTLTLDAGGAPDAVFIFQIGSTLTTASSSSVKVINGAGGLPRPDPAERAAHQHHQRAAQATRDHRQGRRLRSPRHRHHQLRECLY